MHSSVKTPTQLEDGVLSPTFENTVRKKKAYFSQRSSLTPPASISQVIMSLTLIFTLNQNTLMRIRAFLAKNVSHTGNNLSKQSSCCPIPYKLRIMFCFVFCFKLRSRVSHDSGHLNKITSELLQSI